MRLTLALLISAIFFIPAPAYADEIRLECRNYGGMATFPEKHSKFPKEMCAKTGGEFFCEKAKESEQEIQRCVATGQSFTHTQYITFDDENLAGTAKKWAKPCWANETDVQELKIAVSPDLTMSFYGGTGTAFNVNMKTKKAGYLTDREHTCEVINLSEPGIKFQGLEETRNAVSKNDAEAQFKLGQKYHFGQGVPKDYSEAATWYKKAASQGHASAQYNLGTLYSRGQGVSKNYAEAVSWYQKAGASGNANAQYNLGNSYEIGRGIPENKVEALKWTKAAAEQGHADAQYKMGFWYAKGKLVPKDNIEAVKWFRKAAAQGHANATAVLKKLGQ